jgi:hypothetical protein
MTPGEQKRWTRIHLVAIGACAVFIVVKAITLVVLVVGALRP